MADLRWSCRCGAMRGHLVGAPSGGTHIICHCNDCVRAQRHFGVDATAAAGVGIYQTTPDRFVIETGAEHLALAKLSPKGTYRWYARCCGTQIGAGTPTPRFPFIGVLDTLVEEADALGPVRAHVFVPKPGGGRTHRGSLRMVAGLAGRTIGALASGRWRDTPFFAVETGKPVVEPEILPKDAGRAT